MLRECKYGAGLVCLLKATMISFGLVACCLDIHYCSNGLMEVVTFTAFVILQGARDPSVTCSYETPSFMILISKPISLFCVVASLMSRRQSLCSNALPNVGVVEQRLC
jgi:hypothetical protein